MKIRSPFSVLALGAILFSCAKSPKEAPEPTPGSSTENERVNTWIYDEVAKTYYWKDKMAAEGAVDKKLDPAPYFSGILWSEDRQSGFSHIEAAAADTRGDESTGMITDFGWLLMRWNYSNSAANVMQVMQVVPGSPADRAGVRRGDLFSRYNGTQITAQNYMNLYNLAEVTLTRCNEDLYPIDQVTVAKGSYYDTPVLIDTVYRMGDGKNIGYLFYDRFESARGTDDDPDLRAALGRMKAKNVDELILDLRYNGGGYVDISTELATMLLPAAYGRNDVFLYQEYGSQTNYRQQAIRFSGRVDNYRLNLNKLHVITTGNTASASEITVHGLRPYMSVTLYGEQTRGKNVGSYEISGKGENIPWNIYPISSRIYDSRGKASDTWRTFTGFTPDHYFSEVGLEAGGSVAAHYLQGQLGQYDPARGADCDPALNFVMAEMGYTTQLVRTATRAGAEGSPTPRFEPRRAQVAIQLTMDNGQ